MRFWFRAVALPGKGRWEDVKVMENRLFGSTEGQAQFLLSVVDRRDLNQVTAGQNWKNYQGLGYLGYGVVERGETKRPYFEPGGKITLRLSIKKNISQEITTCLSTALKALGLFGAAGARARKGFGSLSLESLRVDGEEKWSVPRNMGELRDRIRELLREINLTDVCPSEPGYTAFSTQAKVSIVKTGKDPIHLLDEIGRELLRYRSYGCRDRNRGVHVLPWREKAEQNFADDHDLILHLLSGRLSQPQSHPRRVVFGLPHNYFFLSTRQKASVDARNYKRRASPLFIHIHALASGEYAAILTLLPAVFLPEGERIKMSGGGKYAEVDCRVNYRDIENFFNRSAFKNGMVVWP
jgi:CRISPR-associated protein Cmr1